MWFSLALTTVLHHKVSFKLGCAPLSNWLLTMLVGFSSATLGNHGYIHSHRGQGAAGREEYIPTEMLRGLLPDTLLERYKFWRHKAWGCRYEDELRSPGVKDGSKPLNGADVLRKFGVKKHGITWFCRCLFH